LKGPSGAGLVQHRIDRGFARSIHAVGRMIWLISARPDAEPHA
jgi:hypothetical protein